MAKYKFTKEHKDARIVIPALRVEITADNINDQYNDKLTYGDLIQKSYKHLSHNLELVEEKAEATKSKKQPDIITDSGIAEGEKK